MQVMLRRFMKPGGIDAMLIAILAPILSHDFIADANFAAGTLIHSLSLLLCMGMTHCILNIAFALLYTLNG